MNKKKADEANESESSAVSERYTIFHALFEAMREKDKKRKQK